MQRESKGLFDLHEHNEMYWALFSGLALRILAVCSADRLLAVGADTEDVWMELLTSESSSLWVIFIHYFTIRSYVMCAQMPPI